MGRLVIAAAGAVMLVASGCTVGPNYKRPAVNTPDQFFHAAPPGANATADTTSLGDEKWFTLFGDPQLQTLVRTALTSSFDVRIAASRILQAQEQVGITRAGEFPTIGAGPGFSSQKLPGLSISSFQLQALVSWTPDFWGRYRRATEAARATETAAEWNRREILSTVVESVAVAYFQMRELDAELNLSTQTLASRRESLSLTQTLLNGGATGLLDVRQAEQLVEEAAETIPDTERQLGVEEDLISTLIGDNPHAIPRGQAFTDQAVPPEIPVGLPSRLLERRPDIQAAEQRLAAATANIGVARAQLFPSLPLTGSAGIQSTNFARLFSGPGAAWNVSASLTEPIFNAGALRSNVRLSEAQQQELVLTYQQTIQAAFRQVSDALIAYQKYREFREHQEKLTAAAEDAARLSDLRYRGGATSYLEVLTSQTNYFAAQLNLSRARLNERLTLVQLYAALGGGWET
ncbi:MAG TPA: efflux transporter outer membrane subunit [Bryobacteraceae bacterium]|nr:efflux transporter outer membrane subunit [Bryobacteraceae bacterium]